MEWITEIKCVDDIIYADRADFEVLIISRHEAGRDSNTLFKPLHQANMIQTTNTTTATSSSHLSIPKLIDIKCHLLYNNEGCHCVFILQCTNNCTNFPDPNFYKTLTQNFVDIIKLCMKKGLLWPCTQIMMKSPLLPQGLPPLLLS